MRDGDKFYYYFIASFEELHKAFIKNEWLDEASEHINGRSEKVDAVKDFIIKQNNLNDSDILENNNADELIKMRDDNVNLENNLAKVKIELQDKNNLNIELLKQIEELKK